MSNQNKLEDLSEDQFIHEEYQKDPKPFWICLLLFVGVIFFLVGSESFIKSAVMNQLEETPFNQVTNREISLFLRENPNFMRVNKKGKASYLPAFSYTDRERMDPSMGDQLALASPEVIFYYHTWKRLVGDYLFPRKISSEEYREFIEDAEEWHPNFWKGAPEDYLELVAALKEIDEKIDLYSKLPPAAAKAFVGWKNYYKEGEAVDQLQPTAGEVRELLEKYPNYQRSLWQNIVRAESGKSFYLEGLADRGEQELLDSELLTSFLKVALYNYRNFFQ